MFIYNTQGQQKSRSLDGGMITVRNDPPKFDLSIPNSAFEDDVVNISVVDVVESAHDLQPGVLTYTYDFGDGNSTTSNQTSITHVWENNGNYTVSVTAVDDQGALSQETETIAINNKAPSAVFTLGAGLPATFSFTQDVVGKLPTGWEPCGSNLTNTKKAIQVIDGKDNLQRILQIEANSDTHATDNYVRNYIGNQEVGSVEYFVMTSNSNQEVGYLSFKENDTEAFSIAPKGGKWQYKVNGQYNDITGCGTPKNDTWHAVRIDFWIDGQYRYFRVYVDAAISSDYYLFSSVSVDSINYVCFGAKPYALGVAHIDALGYSWDPNYELGQNLDKFKESYYGTFDFRDDIFGSNPSNWTVSEVDPFETGNFFGTDNFIDSYDGWSGTGLSLEDSVAGRAEVLKFDASVGGASGIREFTQAGSGNLEFFFRKSQDINEVYITLSDGSTSSNTLEILIRSNYIMYIESPVGWKTIYLDLSPDQWYKFRIHFNCSAGYWNLWVNDVPQHSSGDYDLGFRNSPSYLEDIEISVNAPNCVAYLDSVGYDWIGEYSVGDNCRYSHLDVSVAYDDQYHQEVAQLLDYSQASSVSMEHSFVDNGYGTVETWVKTSNAQAITWTLSLWSSESQAFGVYVDESQWKYRLSPESNYVIAGSGTALSDVWYHLAIHYCCDNSAYFNLSSNQFNVTITHENGTVIASQVYSFNQVDSVNKVRVESSITGTGMAWIDALGFSWDPNYFVNSNKIPLISYPSKTRVQFSGALTIDTVSDISSLRYYWNFGDSASGFGKYVDHSYISAGIYNVSLYVKDNDGEVGTYSQLLFIHNSYPDVNITLECTNMTLKEGETFVLKTETWDDEADWARLMYFYDFAATYFNPLNTTPYENGGWMQSHLYTDDFNGAVGAMVIDPEGASDSAVTQITVENVDPLISIWDAKVVTNVSVEVYRSSTSKEANFSFVLSNGIDTYQSFFVDFEGSNENLETSDTVEIGLSLASDWMLVANSTELPPDSWFKLYVRVKFLDDQELIVSSQSFYSSQVSRTEWELYLNPYFYDSANYHFNYPISFNAQIWDPSIDDVNLTLEYRSEMLLRLSCFASEGNYSQAYNNSAYTFTKGAKDSDGDLFDQDNQYTSFSCSSTTTTDTSQTVLPDSDVQKDWCPITENHWDMINDGVGTNDGVYTQVRKDSYGADVFNMGSFTLPANARIYSIRVYYYARSFGSSPNPQCDLYFGGSWMGTQNLGLGGWSWRYNTFSVDGDQADLNAMQVKLYCSQPPSNPWYKLDSMYCKVYYRIIEREIDFTSDVHLDLEEDDNVEYLNLRFAHKTDASQTITLSAWNFDLSQWEQLYSGVRSAFSTQNVNLTEEQWDSNYHVKIKFSGINYASDFDLYLDQLRVDAFLNNSICLPISSSFELETYGENATFSVNVFLQNGEVYANVSVIQSICSDFFAGGVFPTNIEQIHTLYPLIDLDYLFVEKLGLSNFEILYCCSADNWLTSEAIDDDGGVGSLTIEFSGENGLVFQQFSPKIDAIVSDNASITREVTFYCIVSDFDQIKTYSDRYTVDFKAEDVPSQPEDFNITSGSSDFKGSLYFDDDDFLTLQSTSGGSYELELETTFQLESIGENDAIKYLKLVYALKSDTVLQANFSLFNFVLEKWDLFDAPSLSAKYYSNRYSVLSSEYCNSSNHILLKLEASKPWSFNIMIDQLKMEYFFCEVSKLGAFENTQVPDSVVINTGSITEEGDLSLQDSDYSTLVSSSSEVELDASFYLDGVRPEDALDGFELAYSLKTNVSQSVNLSLYNFNTENFEYITTISLDSGNFYNYTYSTTNLDYFSAYYDFTAKFSAYNDSASEFAVNIDKLIINYSWIKFVSEDYLYESTYTENLNLIEGDVTQVGDETKLTSKERTSSHFLSQSTEISVNKGTSSLDGDIEEVDGNYTSFKSTFGGSGFYNATYSFTDDTNGADPSGFTVQESGDSEIQVIGTLSGHDKVVDMYTDVSGETKLTTSFTERYTGSIEWWWRSDSTNDRFTFALYDVTVECLFVRFGLGSFSYGSGLAEYSTGKSVTANQWYHNRIDFCYDDSGYMGLSDDSFDWYIDGELIVDNEPCYRGGVYGDPDSLSFYGWDSEYHVYLDALDFSWSDWYSENRNADPTYAQLQFTASTQLSSAESDNKLAVHYACLTNVSQTVSVQAWNYVSSQYDTLKSSTHSDFSEHIANLTSNHASGSNQVTIRVNLENINDLLELQVDMLKIAVYEYELDAVVEFQLKSVHQEDRLDQLDFNYNFKTDAHQRLNLSVYNYSSGKYYSIESNQVHTDYGSHLYLIPRDFTNQTVQNWDFVSSNFTVKVKLCGLNETTQFQLFLQEFCLKYKYTTYYFLSKNYDNFDAVEEETVGLDSVITNPKVYTSIYDFENGAFPSDWTKDTGDGKVSFEIASSVGGHSNVLKMHQSDGNSGWAEYQFSEGQESGVIEFWQRYSDKKRPEIQIIDNQVDSPIVMSFFATGKVVYVDHTSYLDTGFAYSTSTWYHCKIAWDCATDWHLWIDGQSIDGGTGYPFQYANSLSRYPTSMDKIRFNIGWLCGGLDWYTNDVGISWDPDYTVGDNAVPIYYVNQTMEIELDGMDTFKYDRLESMDFHYGLKTDVSRDIEVDILLYDYAHESWTKIDALSIRPHLLSLGKYFCYDKDYLKKYANDQYKVKLMFNATSIGEFELQVDQLDVGYDWFAIAIDNGNQEYVECEKHEELSSLYNLAYYENASFACDGEYLITLSADDGYMKSMDGEVITIVGEGSWALIDNFENQTYEDYPVQFNSILRGYRPNTTRVSWYFGDGCVSIEKNPSYSYSHPGVYNITLLSTDWMGNYYIDTANITVLERVPQIVGPFTFTGVEGKAITLEVEVNDAVMDEISLSYEWFDDSDDLVSTDMTPTLTFEDGRYNYTLKVTDANNISTIANISICVEDITPIVSVSSVRYAGMPSTESPSLGLLGDGTGLGEVSVTAYGFDTHFDIEDLYYNWSISYENNTWKRYDNYGGNCSTIHFRSNQTATYQGQVEVIDSKSLKSSVTCFTISYFMDSNGNNICNEIEEQILRDYNITQYTDSDNDFYTDLFEYGITNTSMSDPDTDGDGLFDGINNETGIGEFTYGTDPLDWDSDNDMLSDGTEVFGWEITTELLGTILVNSHPWLVDTDGDSWDDYKEFVEGTHPRDKDTDDDGLQDNEDPNPLKYDNDEDQLNDYLEVIVYGTNPNNTDTDQDGLSDSQEVNGWGFKTNPLRADSDFDFLSDSAEIKSYKFEIDKRYDLTQPVSGSSKIGEQVFYPRPITLDFPEHCTKASSAQVAFGMTFGEFSESVDYGVEDIPDIQVTITKQDDNLVLFESNTNSSRYFSQVVDIKELIESNGLDYRGIYVLTTNCSIQGLILEQFEIEVAKYLDPNDPDYDDDGILDGIEVGLLVQGTDTIDSNSLYDLNNVSTNDAADNTTWITDEFFLTIPDIGEVSDADIEVKVESNSTTVGTGNVTITLVKEDISGKIADVKLIDNFQAFSASTNYLFQTQLDLGDYLTNGTINQLYGNYRLEVKAISTSAQDCFNISIYKITTNTYVEAEATDFEAWITSPDKWDSDGDGWSDYYEIYQRSEMTNPLSSDSDGDGVLDPYDLDPLRNVMVEITPLNGTHGNLALWEDSPDLEIGVSFTVGEAFQIEEITEEEVPYWLLKQLNMELIEQATVDMGESYYFFSPSVQATEKLEEFVIEPFIYYSHYTKSLFDEYRYYVDVPDDNRIQNELNMEIELWHMGPLDTFGIELWDVKLASGYRSYEIGQTGNSETFNVTSEGMLGKPNEALVKVSTVAFEKSNTIAIYDKNTTFNGHYQEQEKMNVIQLYIEDDPQEFSGTPFVQGMNIIAIPTSLFTDTELNGYIQNENIIQTVLYSEDPDEYQFISIDRNANTEKACQELDFVIVRYGLNISESLELLIMLITCITNESLNEQNETVYQKEVLYDYMSAKDYQDLNSCVMNLPKSALEYIPWECIASSEQGEIPESFATYIKTSFTLIAMLPAILIVMIGIAFIQLIGVVIQVASVVWMAVLTYLGPVLWLLIRAALLVLFFVLLGFALLVSSIAILTIGTTLVALSMITPIEASFEFNDEMKYSEAFNIGFIEIIAPNTKLRMEYWIEWKYWSYFDLFIPWKVDKTIYNDVTVQTQEQSVLNGESDSTSLYDQGENLLPFNASSTATHPTLHCGFEDLGEGEYKFSTNYYDANHVEPDTQYGVKLHLIHPNGTALESLAMSTEIDVTPDYRAIDGSLYAKIVDLSTYDEGLWHYYFSAKDKDTGAITMYPENDYLVGPNTSINPAYLFSHHVTSNISEYYNMEGWKTDNFTFYTTWWDVDNGNAPTEVNLCLTPAQTEIGTGVSNTVGVKKFEMEPCESNPDFDEPVEYECTVNFNDLGYNDDEIGTFKYHFEAETTSGEICTLLDYTSDSESMCHYSGLYVKSTSMLNFFIDSYDTNGDGTLLHSDNYLTYIVTVSDYSGTGLSDEPIVKFSQYGDTIEFDMVHYWTSDDNKTKKYYFDVFNEDLSGGYWTVDFSFEYNGDPFSLSNGIALRIDYTDKFTVQTQFYVSEAFLGFDLAVAQLGITPLGILTSVLWGALAFGQKHYLLGSLFALVTVAGFSATTLTSYYESNNIGGLVGYSMACLLMFILLSFVNVDDNADIDVEKLSPIAMAILKITTGISKFLAVVYTLFLFLTPLMSLFYPDNDLVGNSMLLIEQLIAIVPLFLVFIGTAISLVISYYGFKSKAKDSLLDSWQFTVFRLCAAVYPLILIIIAFTGFILATLKMGGPTSPIEFLI